MTRSLSIVIYGDFGCDRLASSYQRAFEQLGHSVIASDVRQMGAYLAPWLRSRIGHRLTIHSLQIRRAGSTRWNRRVVSIAREARPDLILILNGDFLMPETLGQLRLPGAHVFMFHADNPFPPHYANRPETLPCAL